MITAISQALRPRPDASSGAAVEVRRRPGLRPGRAPALTWPELIDLLGAAEGVLAATGSAVALCPTYGVPADQATVGAG
jgi:hypothetical protein